MIKMASLLQISLLMFSGLLWHQTSAQRRLMPETFARNTLCEKGARNGQQRVCYQGGCPNGWRRHRFNNYLMCWAKPNTYCCEREIPPPPPPTTPAPTVNHPQCGTLGVRARIAGGEDETKCLSPWQVSLRRSLDITQAPSIENSNHVAGGVLVQNKWVLTTPLSTLFAGRNTIDENYQDYIVVSLGDYNHRTRDGDEQLRRVSRVFFHPGFEFTTSTDFTNVIISSSVQGTQTVWQENAFALLELEQDALITDCIRPVCLPNGNEERCTTAQCKVTGWGANENEELLDILQKADMTVLGGDVCAPLEFFLNRTETEVPYPARIGCSVNDRGSFACVGDFGGPVVCQGTTVNDPRTVEGLSVTQLDCDNNVVPMRVALVREAMDWIEDTILNNP